jgi:hypothetical protein
MIMDTAQYAEALQFFWGISFTVNIALGVAIFFAVVRRNVPSWSLGASTWVAWWAFANAISLLINVISGPESPFSYHQMGILTETMNNIGILVWTLLYVRRNWSMRDDEWNKVDEFRSTIPSEVKDDPK